MRQLHLIYKRLPRYQTVAFVRGYLCYLPGIGVDNADKLFKVAMQISDL